MGTTRAAMRAKHTFVFLSPFLVLALIASVLNISLAAAPQADVVATFVPEALPLDDPLSPLWDQATPVEVPLSAQNIALPLQLSPAVKQVQMRALHNGQYIAFLLEWEDPQQDLGLGHDGYKDAVALQFPLEAGQPFVCMGIQGQGVHILHWRADFQADIEQGFAESGDLNPRLVVNDYPHDEDPTFTTALAVGNPLARREKASPVEDLSAAGFGTLSAQEHNDALGWGIWQDGRWRVVIGRPLVTTDESDAQLAPGMTTSVAVAVWDGANRERDGQKAVSAWLTLELESSPAAAAQEAQVIQKEATPPPPEATPASAAPTAAPSEAQEAASSSSNIGVIAITATIGLAALGVGYLLGRSQLSTQPTKPGGGS